MKPRMTLLVLAGLMAGSALALGLNALHRGQSGQLQPVSGKALIGGAFTLTDHTGKRVTEKDFAGRHTLVFFGYTYCPDICPAELQVISAAMDELGKKAEKVTPLFITVDPERDTVEQMASYVSNFHQRLVGLTGSIADIEAVARVYRVYFNKVKDETSGDYLMDHSSVVYLMSPKGEYLTHFSYGTTPGKMAEGIAKFL